jgi:hypothetical protein
VADANLTGWSWQVQSFGNGIWGAFSNPSPFAFLPCRLPDATACNTGPGPYPNPSPAYSHFIDFETFPGGQPATAVSLTSQFSSVGLQFTGGAQLFNAAIYYGTGPNYAVWNQSPGLYSLTLTTDPIDMTFEVTGHNFFTFSLQAFDAGGIVIPLANISRQGQVYAQPGTSTLFRRETIRILSTNGVRRIDFDENACLCGLILDNLRF